MQPQSISIKDALEIAKQDPNSAFATQLRKKIESGELDVPAARQGVDLTRFGRPRQLTQQEVSFGLPEFDQAFAATVPTTAASTPATTNEPGIGTQVAQGVTKGLGLEGATDVFGSLLARQGIGTDVSTDIVRQNVQAPTAGQVAGAALQTAAIPAGFAITGGSSLAGQAAIGAGLGYAYDIGADLLKQKSATEVATPGVGTVVGAAAPLAIAGAGRLFNLAYGGATPAATQAVSQALPESAVAQAVPESPITQAVGQTTEDIAMRGARAVQRGREFIETQAERQARISAAPEPVKAAIRANVDDVVVDLAQKADDQTKAVMREMVQMAEAPKTGRVTPNPTAKAGDVAVQQYEAVQKAADNVGKRIGELSDSLPTAQNIDNLPAIQNLDTILAQNDIVLGTDGKLVFNNLQFDDAQQKAIQRLYDIATSRTTLSARQVHQLDRRFATEQRKSQLVDQIGNVYVDTPEGKQNIFALFRNTYRKRLGEIEPQFAELNQQYAQYMNMIESIEGSLIKSKDFGDLIAPDGSVYAEAGLRRMFGEGVNAQANADLYEALDRVARANGYVGPRADELYYFGNKLRDIYPDTIPETGLRKNISTSIRDVIGDAIDIGKPGAVDQQKALKQLLGITDEVNVPATQLTPDQAKDVIFPTKPLTQRAKEVLKDQRGSISVGTPGKDKLTGTPGSRHNTKELTEKGQEYLNAFLAHVDGTKKLKGQELADARYYAQIMADNVNLTPKGNESDRVIADRLADYYSQYAANWKSLGKAKGATPQTTALLEEAKKYKSAEEFIRAQGTPVYHGSKDGTIESFKTTGRERTKTEGTGAFFSSSKDVAKSYFETPFSIASKPKGELTETYVKLKSPVVLDMKGKSWDEISAYTNATVEGKEVDILADILPRLRTTYGFKNDMLTTDDVAVEIRELGQYDGVIFKNIRDSGPNMRKNAKQLSENMVVFDEDAIKTRTQLEDIWKQANK